MGLYTLALAALHAPTLAVQPASFDLAAVRFAPDAPAHPLAVIDNRYRYRKPTAWEAPTPAHHPVEVKWKLKKIKLRVDIPSF